jgi:hypothetical protein
MGFSEMSQLAKQFSVPVAESCKEKFSSWDQLENYCNKVEGLEGFVIQFENKAMYKIKTRWFLEQTSKEKVEYSLQSEKSLWFLILEQQMDDVISSMKDEKWKLQAKEFQCLLWDTIQKVAEKYLKIVTQMEEKDPKNRDELLNEYSKPEKLFLSHLLEQKSKQGFDASESLVKLIVGDSSPKHFDLMQNLLEGIKFFK